MKVSSALAGGLAGTLTVASLHEALKRIRSDAPRMDLLDMDLLRKGLKSMKKEVPEEKELQRWAVGGELLCDTAYFSLAAAGGRKRAWWCGALLGLAAGISAVVLPKSMGLPQEPSNKTLGTKIMTIGLYLIGGITAGVIAQLADKAGDRSKRSENEERVEYGELIP